MKCSRILSFLVLSFGTQAWANVTQLESKIPESKIPESRIPESKIFESKIPETQIIEQQYFSAISDVVKKFKRRITVLEIGATSTSYSFSLSDLYKPICVALLIEGGVQNMVERVKSEKRTNITVLAPKGAQYDVFFTLGRCEHFDVVLVHDILPFIRKPGSKFLEALIKLGDYVFIETSDTKFQVQLAKRHVMPVVRTENSTLYLSHKQKTTLDIARFSQKDRAINPNPKYHVKSSYTEKFFNKRGSEHATKWVDGINLVTFAMLRGVYPEDGDIRKQLGVMKKTHSNHNDLVLGNIIVQGTRLCLSILMMQGVMRI